MNWQEFVAMFINTFGVMASVQLLTMLLPVLKARVGWVIPFLAMSMGPLMALATEEASKFLGVPVDFSPLASVFSGGSAVALHQMSKQLEKIRG
jgi:hypothetical protein